MNLFRRAGVIAAAIALALIAGVASTQAAAFTAPKYRIVYLSAVNNTGLGSVVAPSRGTGWALGNTSSGKSFLLRWNGSRWRWNAPPGPSSFQADALGASAPNNVWLVGIDLKDAGTIGFRFDGISWQPVPMPDMGSPGTPIVLNPSNVWLVNGYSCTFNSGKLAGCSSVLWHWNGQTWTSQTFNRIVIGMAAISGHLWLGALTALQYPAQGSPSGRIAVYRRSSAQWQRIPFSGPRVYGDFDTVAGSSAHDVWIAARPVKQTARQSGVFHFNGRTWAELRVPAAQQAQLLPVVPDGHGGIWLGPWSHWTGRRWVNAFPMSGFPGVDCFSVNAMSAIPGTTQIWSAGWAHRIGARDQFNAMVARFGAAPTTTGASPAVARPVCVVSASQPARAALGAHGL